MRKDAVQHVTEKTARAATTFNLSALGLSINKCIASIITMKSSTRTDLRLQQFVFDRTTALSGRKLEYHCEDPQERTYG
jgi:hypothetical protein